MWHVYCKQFQNYPTELSYEELFHKYQILSLAFHREIASILLGNDEETTHCSTPKLLSRVGITVPRISSQSLEVLRTYVSD